MKNILFFSIISLILISCGRNNTKNSGVKVTAEPTAKEKSTYQGLLEIRGKKYCEIWVVSGSVRNLTASIYNTMGCNDCPAEKWNKIDKDKLRDSLKAKAVVLNGPRVFVMDKIGHSNSNPKKINFQGLEMFEMASVPISLGSIMKGRPKPFRENIVHRNTEFVYLKGTRIFNLLGPSHKYILQSLALEDGQEYAEKLALDLPSRVKLPPGWSFSTTILSEDLIIKEDAKLNAYVLRDDLQNAYLRLK